MTETTQVIVYTPGEAQLVAAAQECQGLTIAGLEDKAGYAKVDKARKGLKAMRTDIERTRKSLKEESLAWGRKVDTEAKRLTAIIEPTELQLAAEQNRIDLEKQKIAAEMELARKAKLDVRMQSLAEVEYTLSPSVVEAFSDDEFAQLLADAAKAHEERAAAARREAERVALAERAAAEERKAERAKLDALRAELEEKAKAHKLEEARLARERAALEDAKRPVNGVPQVTVDEAPQPYDYAPYTDEPVKVRLGDPWPKNEGDMVRNFAQSVARITIPNVWCQRDIQEIIADAASAIEALVPSVKTAAPEQEDDPFA